MKCAVFPVTVALVLGAVVSAAQQPAATQAGPKVSTVTVEVAQVKAPYLVVKVADGSLQVFNINPDRRFVIDGKPVTVEQLKPGTTLTVTYTSTWPPTGAQVTTLTGTVWYVAANNVVLTMPDGKNQAFNNIPDSYRFVVDGQPTTVFDLKPGMKVTANKIPQPPATELRTDVAVTGTTKK